MADAKGEAKVVTKRLRYSQSMLVDTNGPSKCGYLHKKGKMLAGWQQRWFEAVGHYLKYYKDESKDAMLAAIDLFQITIEFPEKSASTGVFWLRHNNGSGKIVLKAGTERIARDWVHYLQSKGSSDAKDVEMEDADGGAPSPRRPRLTITSKKEAQEVQIPGVINANTWNVRAVGAVGAVENSINHNVQLCVVQMPNFEREWHVNNFNQQGIVFKLKIVGTNFRVVNDDGTDAQCKLSDVKVGDAAKDVRKTEAKEDIGAGSGAEAKHSEAPAALAQITHDVGLLIAASQSAKVMRIAASGSWDYRFAWEFSFEGSE